MRTSLLASAILPSFNGAARIDFLGRETARLLTKNR